jgi:hypothetical protein
MLWLSRNFKRFIPLHEEKTTWYKTQKSLLDDRQKFQIIPQQQIAAL